MCLPRPLGTDLSLAEAGSHLEQFSSPPKQQECPLTTTDRWGRFVNSGYIRRGPGAYWLGLSALRNGSFKQKTVKCSCL